MSLKGILEDYLIDLDKEGMEIYKAMRKAEDDWIKKTGFEHYDFGSRTHLLIARHTTELPPLDAMLPTRAEFKRYIEENLDGRPQTIGDRSTSLPVWLLQSGKLSVATSINGFPIEPVEEIHARTQVAWRSALLTREEVMSIFGRKFVKVMKSIEGYEKSRHKTKQEQAETALAELKVQRDQAIEIFDSYSDVTARLQSGAARKFWLKSDSEGWETSIANVGIVFGTPETKMKIQEKRQRNRMGHLHRIAEIGSLVFFSRNPLHHHQGFEQQA